MFTDVPLDRLDAVSGSVRPPEDYEEFWRARLAGAHAAWQEPVATRVDTGVRTLETWDVRFSGFGGDPINAWLKLPSGASGSIPVIVEYAGYGGGRALPTENLLWASCGFAHLVMDTRGQGSEWSHGSTPDPHGSGPRFPGMLTAGVTDPAGYYYTRLAVDGVMALRAVRRLAPLEAGPVVTFGHSQGGWLALVAGALAAWAPEPLEVAACIAEAPFLCDVLRAVGLTDAHPYREIVQYLAVHRDAVDVVGRTLSYVDAVCAAPHVTAPCYLSAGGMDTVCPPSTVAAAANALGGDHLLEVWRYNGHEAGGPFDTARELEFLADVGVRP
ncbi:MAG TPA: acetylxylan esterase [Cellulomonas sp.]